MSANNKYSRFAANHFTSREDVGFSPVEYSHLKFGSDVIAKKFGHELAVKFFNSHSDVILANRCVVIPSPYNHVENAATLMTKHFVNKLNELLVMSSGNCVEMTLIHRKVSYINDYGFLSKEKRRGLIDNDEFYLNKEFIAGKLLICIDDVRITGTHEEKLIEVLQDNHLENRAFFLYFGSYSGSQPDIEAFLNFSGVSSLDDYVALTKQPNHQLIVRPIKYLLSQKDPAAFARALHGFSAELVERLYHACLGEGYHRIPSYQSNIQVLIERVGQLSKT